MRQKYIEKSFEIVLLLLFLGFFLFQSYTIYLQYKEGKTSFATNFKKHDKLDLPEVTVCPFMPDTSMDPYSMLTEEVYNETYPIWTNMWALGNAMNISETRSYDKGRCWTMGYLNGSVGASDLYFNFQFYTGYNGSKVTPVKKFYIYVHEPGEAFILTLGVYDFETVQPIFIELGEAESGIYYDLRFTKRIRTRYQVIYSRLNSKKVVVDVSVYPSGIRQHN